MGRNRGEEWFRSAEIRTEMELFPDEFVVMPNHIHGIIWIVDDVGARRRRAPTKHRAPTRRRAPTMEQFGKPVPGSIPTIVRAFKSAVTRCINQMRGTPGARVWQRNYYEHIIRDDRALGAVRQYILENPQRWHLDRYNPAAMGNDPMARDIWRMLHNDDTGPVCRAPTCP
nr:transposase [Parvivirga hydrogeniphila]